MKNFYVFFLIVLFACNRPQIEFQIVENHKRPSNNLHDTIYHQIEASSQGALFRFIHPNFKTSLWTLDSLVDRIIYDNNLSSLSSEFEIVYAAASYIKKGGVEKHINGYEFNLPDFIDTKMSQKNYSMQTLIHPLSFNSFNSKLCGEFNYKVYVLVSLITEKLSCKHINIRGVGLSTHQTNEYWDTKLSKWVYFDVDPQSEIFFPRENFKLVSIEELIANNLILKDSSSYFHQRDFGQEDSLSIFYSTRNTARNLIDVINICYYTFEKFNKKSYPNDIFYKLLPHQKIKWSYDISSLVLEKYMLNNECSKEHFINLLNFFSNDSLLSSLNENEIINIVSQKIGVIAKCYRVDSAILSNTLLGESLTFGDSTYYTINGKQEQFFSTIIPVGNYSINDIYIPNIIRSISGGDITFKSGKKLKDGFFWLLPSNDEVDIEEAEDIERIGVLQTLTQSFSVNSDITITFLGNYDIQLVPNIALFDGNISVKTWLNGNEVVK